MPLHDRTIVILSSIDWAFLWQGHQEIATRLAQSGNDVIFVENTGVRTIGLVDVPRVLSRLRRVLFPARSTHPRAGVTVIAPFLVPFPRSRVASAVNRTVLLPRLARRIARSSRGAPVIFTFLPTPNALRLVRLLRQPGTVVVYYCIADFGELSDIGQDLIRSEEAIAREADLIFVQSAAFAERLARVNPRVHEFRFGVNVETLRPLARRDAHPDVRDLPRPVIGYSGGIHRHVDVALLARVADAFPSGSLALVGPVQSPADALRTRANVRFLGMRPFEELPRVLAGFDVGLVPYIRSTYTETVFPTKLFEYLAVGLPVVASDLPEVRRLALPRDDVRIAADPAAFVAEVRRMTSLEPIAARIAARVELARERDWDLIVARMSALMERATAGTAR